MDKNCLELTARFGRIEIQNVECDPLVEKIEKEYQKMFAIPVDGLNYENARLFAEKIVENSKDIRVFAIQVCGNGDIVVSATMDSVPDVAFSYLVRRDFATKFDAYMPSEDTELFKCHFEITYRSTKVTIYAKEGGEWEPKTYLIVEPNGNSQVIQVKSLSEIENPA